MEFDDEYFRKNKENYERMNEAGDKAAPWFIIFIILGAISSLLGPFWIIFAIAAIVWLIRKALK